MSKPHLENKIQYDKQDLIVYVFSYYVLNFIPKFQKNKKEIIAMFLVFGHNFWSVYIFEEEHTLLRIKLQLNI